MTGNFMKAISLGWPFLLMSFSCSSSKKQLYYFDHHQYKEPITVIKSDTPVVYTSTDPTITIPTRLENIELLPAKVIVKKRRSLVSLRKLVVRETDSVPKTEQSHAPFKDYAGGLGMFSAFLGAVLSLVSWPVGLAISCAALTFSVIGLWSQKKTPAFVGIILSVLAIAISLAEMVNARLGSFGDGFNFNF